MLSQEFIDTIYMPNAGKQRNKNDTSTSIKDLLNETIRKRSDYKSKDKKKWNPSSNNENTGTGMTQNPSTNFIKDMSSKDTQSKTILH